jgi:Zn-dependent protease with chaperone function
MIIEGQGMAQPERDHERKLARQARAVAFVIAGTMLLWMGAQWVGGKMGLEARYVFLFDFAALAAFFWALVVTYQIWRKRQG